MPKERILVTGSSGLLGRALSKRLLQEDLVVVPCDIRPMNGDPSLDICDREALSGALRNATGIIHLAAVSRVIHGENDPTRCWEVNAEATRGLLDLALKARNRPWFVYASSREVYGQQDEFPVKETSSLRPMNIYARSKVEAERYVEQARRKA